jgi:hypothetical protein
VREGFREQSWKGSSRPSLCRCKPNFRGRGSGVYISLLLRTTVNIKLPVFSCFLFADRTAAHVAGGERRVVQGERSRVPSSLGTVGCGERGGTATKLTLRETRAGGGGTATATKPPAGGRVIGLSSARPRRSGRVSHTRSHTHTSHRPHRSEFSPCRVMSWPCRANDVLINAERAAQSAATGDYSRTKSPNPHVPSTLCTSYELCVAHAHGIAAHRRVYPSGIRADAPPTLKLTTPQPAKGISPQIMLVIL